MCCHMRDRVAYFVTLVIGISETDVTIPAFTNLVCCSELWRPLLDFFFVQRQTSNFVFRTGWKT